MRASLFLASVAFVGASVSARGSGPGPETGQPADREVVCASPDAVGRPGHFRQCHQRVRGSTPFERPDDFAGRRLEEVQGDELANFRAGLQKRTLSNFEGPLHGPDHWWQSIYDLRKGGQAWFVLDPPDGRIQPTTEEAQRASEEPGPGRQLRPRRILGECRRLQPVRSLHHARPARLDDAGHLRQLLPDRAVPGTVAIQYEMIHETRVIPLDGRPMSAGASGWTWATRRGHWEGDTLVVETTNFKERSAYRNANPETLRIIERFQRIAPDKVQWAVTVDDPTTWTRPWTFSMPLTMDDSEQIAAVPSATRATTGW